LANILINHSISNISFSAIQPVVSTGFAEYDDYSSLPDLNYFVKTESRYNNEKELYDVLMMESYNDYGVSAVYYKTTYDTNYDKIFGEDRNRMITNRYDIMVYYELPRELEMWSKFGIE
jgi:hypothetical protein